MKTFLLDVLTKTLLPSKTKLSKESVNKLSPFLRLLNHDEFKGTVLPVMNKAMLRSPEVAISTVIQHSCIVSEFN